MANLPPDHNEFALPAEDAPNNMNGWIKEEEEEEEDPEMEEEEDPEMEEEEEEEMEINDEMDDPEVIYPYEIEEGELPPPHAESDTSSDTKPEVEAEVEDKNKAATVGTITRAPYCVQPFSGTTYIMMANLPPNHNEFALAAEAAPNNMNGWIEEEEDLEMEEEEDPEMEEE
ncbi:hypothetical protein Tco_0778537 [Tanacetum coccineum]